MAGTIRIGIGGWTYPDWRGAFYPKGLPQKQELSFAARALGTIEINATYRSSFKPSSWKSWRAETPEGFVFSVKASQYCTNRRDLGSAEAKASIARFFDQGIVELGDRLGPINWQLHESKCFEAAELAGFLELLPRKLGALRLRHALEVRHESFRDEAFPALARRHGVAIVYADHAGDTKALEAPAIDEPTADFTYARLMIAQADEASGVTKKQLAAHAKQARAWAKRGDVFLYFISAAKEKNPLAAMALASELGVAPEGAG